MNFSLRKVMGLFSEFIKFSRLQGLALVGSLIVSGSPKVLAQPNLESVLNEKILEVQAEFKSLNLGFVPEIDYQRAFANQALWVGAHTLSPQTPWAVLGREKLARWRSVSNWIFTNPQAIDVHESTVKELYQRLGIVLNQTTLQQVASATKSYRTNLAANANSPTDRLTESVNLYIELFDLFHSNQIDPHPLQHLLDLMTLKQGLPPTLEHINPLKHQDLTRVFFDILGGFLRYIEAKRTTLVHPDTPTTLYHWTNEKSLAQKMKNRTNPEMPPMSFISEEFFITDGRESLIGKPALFAWNNPFGAVADGLDKNGNKKWYVGNDLKNGQLVILDLKPQARVLFLRTIAVSEDVIVTEPVPDLKGYDLIHHTVQEADRTRAFSEWIIINPGAVTHFTWEKEEVKNRLQSAIDRFKTTRTDIPRDDLHLPNMPLTRSEILDHLGQALGLPLTSPGARSCRGIFETAPQ